MEPGPGTRPPRTWAAGVLLLAALSFLSAGVSGKAPATRNAIPPAAATPPAPPAPPSAFLLPNGLEVRLHPVPDAQETTILLLFKGGRDLDPPRISDGVHLLEHLFLWVGSRSRIPRRLCPWDFPSPWRGLHLSGATWGDRMVIRWTCPGPWVPAEIAEVAARMRGLCIDEPTWEQERRSVLGQIRERKDEDSLRWWAVQDRLPRGNDEEEWADDREKGLDRLSLEGIRGLEREVLRPDRALLVVAGNFDADPVRRSIDACLGSVPRPATAMRRSPAPKSPPMVPGLRTAVRPRSMVRTPRLLLTFPVPVPGYPGFPAALAAVHRLRVRGLQDKSWDVTWVEPLAERQVVLSREYAPDWPAVAAWEETVAAVQQALREPPDAEELRHAQEYGRQILGLDDWFAALGGKDLEEAAYLEAMAAWKGIDREAAVDAVSRVRAGEFARAVEAGFAPDVVSGFSWTQPPATDWTHLRNGVRLGVHPMPEAERASVALLLPYGRRNGPSPVVARLFAHARTPGWGVSPWSVWSGQDVTVLWWAGAPRSLGWIARDLALRLRSTTTTEEDLARERAHTSDLDPAPSAAFSPEAARILREGVRALGLEPREERRAPCTVAEANTLIAGWCRAGGVTVVVAGPFAPDPGRTDPTTSLLVNCLDGLPTEWMHWPLPAFAPREEAPDPSPPPGGRACQAFRVPRAASPKEFASQLVVGFRHGALHRRPPEPGEVPRHLFDPLVEPGILVRVAPAGRRPSSPFLSDEETPDGDERFVVHWLLGEHLGGVEERPATPGGRTIDSPVTRAVREALLDFRGIDARAVLHAIDTLSPEDFAEAVRKLREAVPVEFAVREE